MTLALLSPPSGSQAGQAASGKDGKDSSTISAARHGQPDHATAKPQRRLVALGVISPAKANLIQRGLCFLLNLHREPVVSQPLLGQDALIELCRADKNWLNIIQPFLTDEQVAFFLNGAAKEVP